MDYISSNAFRSIMAFVLMLLIAFNASEALQDAKKSRHFMFGIDIAFGIYWILMLVKFVF